MSDLARMLEEELMEAVEVKNRKSLHRYITILTGSISLKEENRMEHTEFQQELIKIDGRFNQMITEMREGFKRMDLRFETMQEQMNLRFGSMQEQMDQRFTSMQEQTDRRSVLVDKRFEAMDARFNRQTILLSIGFVVITSLITVYQFLG